MATRDAITGESRGDRRRAGLGASRAGSPARADEGPARDGRIGLVLAAGAAVLIFAWAVLNFVFEQATVAVLSSETSFALATIGSIDKLIGALVLFLLAADVGRQRLRWVAAGFVVLGLGQYVFKWLITPLLGLAPGLSTHVYEKLVVLVVAYALLVVGLLPDTPPRFSWRWSLAILAGFGALGAVTLIATTDLLPPLVEEGLSRRDTANVVGHAPLPGLTGWHFAFFTIPLVLTIVAALGTARHNRGKTAGVG